MKLTKLQLKQLIKEELTKSGYLGNGYKWCPAGSKCSPQETKTKWWKGK